LAGKLPAAHEIVIVEPGVTPVTPVALAVVVPLL
jgi:hypothetical protein